VPGYGSIFRVYEVIGIEHKITRDDWNAKFYLKLHDQYKSHAKIATSPEMIMTAASSGVGNTNTNFSARLQNYSFVDAKQVLWSYEAQQLKGDVVSFGWSPYYLDFITATSAVSAITNPAQTISKTWNYDASTSKVFLDYWGDEPYLVQQDPTYTPDRWDFAGDKAIIAYTQLDDYWWRKSEPCIGQDCNNYLKVSAAIPTANFTYTNNNGTVTFNNASFDNDTNLWNFGVTPAATSNATNPVYTYAASGTYSVTLTVDNGVATSSITKNVFVPIARVPWRLMRFDISGTRDFINGVWTKYLPGGMMQVQSNHNSTNTLLQQNSAYPGKGDTTSTTGKIILTRDFTSPYLFDPWDATTSDSTRNISVFTGTNQNVAAAYNNGIEFIAATSMPSGNLRETIDVKIYFIIPPEATQSQRTTVAGLVGFFTSYRNSAGSLVNGVPVPSRVLFQPNQTHEKIKVFVSDYNTQDMAVAKGALPTWYEIGYWQININQTTYDNLFFTRAMTPIVPLPLVYP
jgi:PKD repeat protein